MKREEAEEILLEAKQRKLIFQAEKFMLEYIEEDVAHDRFHIYRVLNLAIDIAQHEEHVDFFILIMACLLHDIGRKEQDKNPEICHAEAGAKIAYHFLIKEGLIEKDALAIKSAIESHRYRSRHAPHSIEAKILFDADTIDVTGAMGIARSLQYEGKHAIPIYNVNSEGNIITGPEQNDSVFKEYKYKLEKLYERLYTERGKELAFQRKQIAQNFYEALLKEVNNSHSTLEKILHMGLPG